VYDVNVKQFTFAISFPDELHVYLGDKTDSNGAGGNEIRR